MSDGVVFVDTETTGLDPDLNPVWEIAVIRDGVEHIWQVRLPRELPIVSDDGPPPDGPYMTEWVLENTGWRDRYDDDQANALLDEDPRSYKDIDQVMADQHDLVTVRHTLSQVLNYKGA